MTLDVDMWHVVVQVGASNRIQTCKVHSSLELVDVVDVNNQCPQAIVAAEIIVRTDGTTLNTCTQNPTSVTWGG